ncbi:unnamed protein product [Debaryomyces tyrocola]|nr:unnamed protein product [Debaryomyces tyrocola]
MASTTTYNTLLNWSYKRSNKDSTKWQPCLKKTTGNQIHTDLLNNGEIPDPFIDRNEKDLQWIGEEDWEYKTTFKVSSGKKHELVFEGLDTFATIYVNYEQVLTTDNMFRTYTLDVTNCSQELNELRIVFKSALKHSRALEEKHGTFTCFNGETSRVHARKAQYHYGWDWGPLFLTCGPWKPVKLVTYSTAKINDFYVKPTVDENLHAELSFEVEVESISDDCQLLIEIFSSAGKLIKTIKESANKSYIFDPIKLEDPELWYPKGYGKQPLYKFVAKLQQSGQIIDSVVTEVGVRRARLVQEPVKNQDGSSFYFEVNNIPIFCNGSNWIPAHSFSCSLTDDDYVDLIRLADEGNQNMIRVWGGGFYENDILYKQCDKLGILVWQDFMFGCAIYPGYKEFIDNVTHEVVDQLKRLRNFCSIVFYVGNNEDYQVAEDLYKKNTFTDEEFPAKKLYERILPDMVSKLTSGVGYQFGSPISPGQGLPTTDVTVGDIHQWNVWHGTQEKYQDWGKLVGRFVSEFGMLAFPDIKTLKDCITDEEQLYPQLETMDHHNKSIGFERRLALYVMENFLVSSMALPDWIYITQLMQLDCLAYAYRNWKREWGSKNERKCGGALVWQINDCWPVTSWAIIDFYHRPKLAYYAIKRECQPLMLGIYRTETRLRQSGEPDLEKQAPLHDYAPREYTIDVWGVNSMLQEFSGTLEVEIYHCETGELVSKLPKSKITLAPNQTTELVTKSKIDSNKLVVHAKLVDSAGKFVSNTSDWPQPLKYITWPKDTKLDVSIPENGTLKLSTNKPVKGIALSIEGDYYLHDNSVDLLPNNDHYIKVDNLQVDDVAKISVNYLK